MSWLQVIWPRLKPWLWVGALVAVVVLVGWVIDAEGRANAWEGRAEVFRRGWDIEARAADDRRRINHELEHRLAESQELYDAAVAAHRSAYKAAVESIEKDAAAHERLVQEQGTAAAWRALFKRLREEGELSP